MDGFGLIIVAGVGMLVLWLLLLGRYYPGNGSEAIDWRPTRSVEAEIELEIRDVAEMLEAQNRRRRARGEVELSEEAIEQRVARDRQDLADRRERYLADQDLSELLEATNLRRRKRGLRDLSLAQLQAEVGARAATLDQPPAGAAGAPPSARGAAASD